MIGLNTLRVVRHDMNRLGITHPMVGTVSRQFSQTQHPVHRRVEHGSLPKHPHHMSGEARLSRRHHIATRAHRSAFGPTSRVMDPHPTSSIFISVPASRRHASIDREGRPVPEAQRLNKVGRFMVSAAGSSRTNGWPSSLRTVFTDAQREGGRRLATWASHTL